MAAEHHEYGAFGSSGALPPAAATTAVATLAQSDECNDHTDREGAGRWQAAWRRSIASLAVCAGLGLAATRVVREPPARWATGSAGLSSADRSSAEHTPTDSLPATALESSDARVAAELGADVVSENTTRPNVVFFVVDDMGFNDIGYQSSDLADVTPNMNRLASEGVTIDWYYSATTCTPARAALHTGVHWARSGMWWGDVASDTPFALGVRTPTLAERLRRHGYRTHLVGKWDVGHSNASYWPTNRGFDSFYGLFGAEYGNYTTHESYRDRYYTVYDLVQIDAALAPVVGGEAGIASSSASVSSAPRFDKRLGYATNIFRDRTIELIDAHVSDQRDSGTRTPLFMMLAFNAVHSDVSVPSWFKQTSAWREIVQNRTSGDAVELRTEFAGALWLVDDAVGRVVEATSVGGLYDETIYVLVSDNGGMIKNGGNNYPLRGQKTTQWEGGYRVPALIHSALLPRASIGTHYQHVFQVTDWLPTLVGGALASEAELTEDETVTIDGVSHWDALMGRNATAPRSEVLHDIYYLKTGKRDSIEYEAWLTSAIRKGDWKLITHQTFCDTCAPTARSCHCNGNVSDFLFNLADDPFETTNLIYSAGAAAVAQTELLARLAYHYEHTLTAARYRSKDKTAAAIFEENGGFVTEWTAPESSSSSSASDMFRKPDVATIQWLESEVTDESDPTMQVGANQTISSSSSSEESSDRDGDSDETEEGNTSARGNDGSSEGDTSDDRSSLETGDSQGGEGAASSASASASSSSSSSSSGGSDSRDGDASDASDASESSGGYSEGNAASATDDRHRAFRD